MEQRPAAVIFLNVAQIYGHAFMQRLIDRAKKMIEQDIFGRNGGIGLQLEDKRTVGRLQSQQSLAALGERFLKLAGGKARTGRCGFKS